MSTDNKSRVEIDFDPVYGEPFSAEVTDTTAWPSERATDQAIETLLKVYNLGFEGLKIKYVNLANNENLLSQQADLKTPEGYLVNYVMGLAKSGIEFPTQQVLALLVHIYKSEGLPLPKARPRNQQIYWSEIEVKK
jgi:hypothetical protein